MKYRINGDMIDQLRNRIGLTGTANLIATGDPIHPTRTTSNEIAEHANHVLQKVDLSEDEFVKFMSSAAANSSGFRRTFNGDQNTFGNLTTDEFPSFTAWARKNKLWEMTKKETDNADRLRGLDVAWAGALWKVVDARKNKPVEDPNDLPDPRLQIFIDGAKALLQVDGSPMGTVPSEETEQEASDETHEAGA